MVKKCAVFGDSFVAAANNGRPGYARLAPLLMRCSPVVLGSGGTGFVKISNNGRLPYISRVDDLTGSGADVVVVQASGNDALCDMAEVEEAAYSFLAIAKKSAGAIYVLGPMWTIAGPENLPSLRDAVERASDRASTRFIDALSWLSPSLIGPDGEHPTWKGHAVIAWRLASAIRKLD